MFLKWSPVGVFSCIVFLEYLPHYRPCIEDRHWRYQVQGYNRCESQKGFAWLEMEYLPPAERTFPLNARKEVKENGQRKRR